jgi:hypothetical protein
MTLAEKSLAEFDPSYLELPPSWAAARTLAH